MIERAPVATKFAEHDALRIQLEGRFELVEALTARWQQANDLLASMQWLEHSTRWSELVKLSEAENEALERLREHSEAVETVRAFDAAQRKVAALARHRMRAMGFAPRSKRAGELVAELRGHHPIMLNRRFTVPLFTVTTLVWSLLAAPIVMFIALVVQTFLWPFVQGQTGHYSGDATVVCCVCPFAGVLLPLALNRLQIKVTRLALKIGRRQLDFSSIRSLSAQTWGSTSPQSSGRQTRLKVEMENGKTHVFNIGGDVSALLKHLQKSGIPCDFS